MSSPADAMLALHSETLKSYSWDGKVGFSVGDSFATNVDGLLSKFRDEYKENVESFTSDMVTVLQRVGVCKELYPVLSKFYGYDTFRPGQMEAIMHVMFGADVLTVLPTGGGKSLTYQLPIKTLNLTGGGHVKQGSTQGQRRGLGTCLPTPGVAVVVSPLISLMQDQVDNANAAGVRACYLNSTLTNNQRSNILRDLRDGGIYDLVYVSPEGLEMWLLDALRGVQLSYLAVDEAHCISQWGHDFRPAYLQLAKMRETFTAIPFMGLTATANVKVQEDIAKQLHLRHPYIYKGGAFRPNLKISTHKKGAAGGKRYTVREEILNFLTHHPEDNGIIYTTSRKNVESLTTYLQQHGVKAGAYHAGLSDGERETVQNAFRDDTLNVIVATIAFGMGIDKSNVRFVIHKELPKNLSGYIQEIGRAGRDGEPAQCLLFYSWADVKIVESMKAQTGNYYRSAVNDEVDSVRNMYSFAEAKVCYHRQISAYFGEVIKKCVSSCSQCEPDMHKEFLTPSPHTTSPSFTTKPSKKVEKGNKKVGTIQPSNPVSVTKTKVAKTSSGANIGEWSPADEEMFTQLKNLRKKIAQENAVPPYIVFNDKTLKEMVEKKPATDEQLRQVKGVGDIKLELYGEQFLTVLNDHPTT